MSSAVFITFICDFIQLLVSYLYIIAWYEKRKNNHKRINIEKKMQKNKK